MIFEHHVERYHCESLIGSTDSVLRLHKYSPAEKEKSHEGIQEHTDLNLTTIIYQNHVNGLEVKTKHDDQWIGFDASPNSFIFMTGDAFQSFRLAMSSEEYDSDCDSVTETEGSGDEVEVVQPSSETVTTAPRSSKENDKFKPARNTRGRRLRAAAKERSRVWAHYTRYDEPIMGIVDGKEQQIGIEKRAQCYPGKVDLETQHTMNADVLDPNGNVVVRKCGNSIGKILETCMMEWNLDKVLTISVDNASANKVAIEYLIEKMSGWPRQPIFGGKYMHVRCLAHILNLIVKSGLHIMNKSVASIRNAVRYVRSSRQRLEAFKACVEKEKIPCKKVCVLDVPTRWNSTYTMLDTTLQLKKAFNRMADEEDGRYRSYFDEDEELNDEGEEAESQVVVATQQQKKRVGPLVVSDWEKASVLVKYLKVYLDTTVDVSAQLKPTAHKAFVDIAIVKAELDEMFNKPLSSDASETDKVFHGMANKMRAKFRKYFGSVDDIN
ncbi:hypothetical protein ACLB2K_076966 [Fragaria x ananassa]